MPDRQTADPDAGLRPDAVDFLRTLAVGRRLSENTVKAYRRDLRDLHLFLNEYLAFEGWTWADVDRLTLRSFMGWGRRRGLSRRTLGRKLSATRSFFRFLHTEDRIGMPKVESARIALEALNPDVKVVAHQTRIDSSNVEELFADYDVIVDGSDNLPTRYLINDACVKLKKPNVHAAVYRFEGQITVFWPDYQGDVRGSCYRCMFPEPPPPELAPSCAEAGVLGVMPGLFGLLQAVETIKILLGIGTPLVSRMLHYDALSGEFMEMRAKANPSCRHCSDGAVFPGYEDYAQVCSSSPATDK